MSFWEYSNSVYRIEGVPQACLVLQNDHALDVNMVLFCCWHGIYFGSISKDLLNQCLTFSHNWSDNAVKPLRHMRTWMKTTGCNSNSINTEDCMSYRDNIKTIELEAEKLQQMTLESYCPKNAEKDLSINKKTEAAGNNLRHYLITDDIEINDPVIQNLEIIFRASINDFDMQEFRAALTNN